MNGTITARMVGPRGRTVPDARDEAILAERVAARELIEGPRVGDFVEFADGPVRRISYIWTEQEQGFWSARPGSVQTSDHGSYYLCESGGISMSGSLYTGVPSTSLRDTGEVRSGLVWFFHNDWAMADNGVYAEVPCRVYRCILPATTS